MSFPYNDILCLPHHVSKLHPSMGMQERAAQFAPFAALTGYDEAITESRRLTDRQIELSEDEKAVLDQKQHQLLLLHQPTVTITYFVPDARKQGGSYKTVTKVLRRMDPVSRTLQMTDGQCISLDRIIALDLSELPSNK